MPAYRGRHLAVRTPRRARARAARALARRAEEHRGQQWAAFAGRVLDKWAHRRGVGLAFIQPGTPTQNGDIESSNGRLHDEFLNLHWFLSHADARRTIADWRERYNSARPHSGLAGRTPSAFAALQLVKSTITTRLSAYAKQLKALEEENRRLKRVVAHQALNLQVLKDVLGKEW